MKNSLVFVGLLFLLYGCVEPSLIVGQPGPAVADNEIKVYYSKRPRCDFETIAHIRVTGGYFTLESMFGEMRHEAALLGADGLYVLETRQLGTREYLGTAKAIRCLSA